MGIRPHRFTTEQKPRCIYFMVDHLLHTISKLQCRHFHVVAKNSYQSTYSEHRDETMHHVVACDRLKTMENYYTLSCEKWFWLLRGGHHVWKGL